MEIESPKRIDTIREYLRGLPNFDSLNSNNDFMVISTELMNHTLYLQRFGLSLAPNEKIAGKGVSKRHAVIMGHMVRQMKLYEGFLMHVAKRQFELASIFIRLIYETNVRVDYFISTKANSTNSYIFTSYRSEKETLIDLRAKGEKRPLIHIEQRMQSKIKNRLKRDGISQKRLLSNKNWKLDNKSFKDILIFLNREKEYYYMFGSASHFIHGDWYELSNHHLHINGRYYQPNLHYDDPDPRISSPISVLCLSQLSNYLKWRRCDPTKHVISLSDILIEVFLDLDHSHENFYQRNYTT